MAKDPVDQEEDQDDIQPIELKKPKGWKSWLKASRWKSLLNRQYFLVALGCLVLFHVVFLSYLKATIHPSHSVDTPEVTLGDFEFLESAALASDGMEASFSLHISLLEAMESKGRYLLLSRQNKIKQEIEQLLRQAHKGDFEDPTLAELKRQLQELINQTLETRVVEEVIITNLDINWGKASSMQTDFKDPQETSTAPQWREKTSS